MASVPIATKSGIATITGQSDARALVSIIALGDPTPGAVTNNLSVTVDGVSTPVTNLVANGDAATGVSTPTKFFFNPGMPLSGVRVGEYGITVVGAVTWQLEYLPKA